MGYGDELLGSGLARGAAARGRKIAFGDGQRIMWHRNSHEIFKGNPNVAEPGQERLPNLEWIEHYSGARAYCRKVSSGWEFNPSFRATPGELFLTDPEREWAASFGDADVIIEPNVKHSAPNKQWPVARYQEVADELAMDGFDVAQFATGRNVLAGVRQISLPSFRMACAALERAQLYLGPEGGLHHAAAALNVKAVVIFGGFISPKVTGYDCHTNLFTGTGLGCGNIAPCGHCRECMEKITVDEVYDAACRILN